MQLGARGWVCVSELGARERGAGPRRAAPSPDTDSAGRASGPDTESARRALGDTQTAGPRHREQRAPTQRATGPDTESAGARQRAQGPDTESAGSRHRQRESGGARHRCIKNSDCMCLNAGNSRCHGRSFSREKRTDDPESVHQWLLQSASHSVCF